MTTPGVLSVIIPAYNEAATIRQLLEKVKAVQLIRNLSKEIIIVNDGSVDDTATIVSDFMAANPELSIQYHEMPANRGKGAAVTLGISNATGEYLVIQDADLEYNPEEYNILLEPIVDDLADVVYGSRFLGGGPHRVLYFWHSVGNSLLTTLSNMFTDLNLTDMETCYKLFKTDIIQNIDIRQKGFGFEPEITAKISKIKGIRIYEVGISYFGRTYEEGKKINIWDGFRAIYYIVRYNWF